MMFKNLIGQSKAELEDIKNQKVVVIDSLPLIEVVQDKQNLIEVEANLRFSLSKEKALLPSSSWISSDYPYHDYYELGMEYSVSYTFGDCDTPVYIKGTDKGKVGIYCDRSLEKVEEYFDKHMLNGGEIFLSHIKESIRKQIEKQLEKERETRLRDKIAIANNTKMNFTFNFK